MAPTVVFLLGFVVVSSLRCGSFDDYRSRYAGTADILADVRLGEPWQGSERVRVATGGVEREVALRELPSMSFRQVVAVSLSGVVLVSGSTAEPERFRYDFTAADGYDLLAKRGAVEKLPSWTDLQHGYLYRNPDGDLRVGWDADTQPWGSAVSAYRVKYMDGGLITLLPASGSGSGSPGRTREER